MNDTELGLFSAAVLITADRSGVTDVKAIQQHQDKIIDALKIQVRKLNELGNNALCRQSNSLYNEP